MAKVIIEAEARFYISGEVEMDDEEIEQFKKKTADFEDESNLYTRCQRGGLIQDASLRIFSIRPATNT